MFSGLVNFALCLVTTAAVVTSLPPVATDIVAWFWDITFLIILVTVEPALFVNVIVSPIFKSVVKLVPLPNKFVELFAIDILPVMVSFVPYV